MKRKVTAALVLLCIIASFLLPAVKAAGTVYFSVINNDPLPLNDATMPAFIDGQFYLPYTFFSSDELGIYSGAGSNIAVIYSSASKRLTFDVAQATVYDQDGNQHYLYSAKTHNGIIYIPVELICQFFGFTYAVIQADPAPIVRVRTPSNNINDLTYPGLDSTQKKLQALYAAYTGKPNPSASPTSSAGIGPTYQNVTVYLSFFDLGGGKLSDILDALSLRYKGCFFVTKDEIAGNADLLRRAAGDGHMIGIWLKDGTYDEYQEASALLFEAAKLKTVIVTAGGASAGAAEAMAGDEGLVFWRSTRSYDAAAKFTVSSLTGSLSTVSGRESIAFACSAKTSVVLRSFLSYLTQYEYNVRRITETSVPIQTVD